jgi:hypothetical protein
VDHPIHEEEIGVPCSPPTKPIASDSENVFTWRNGHSFARRQEAAILRKLIEKEDE